MEQTGRCRLRGAKAVSLLSFTSQLSSLISHLSTLISYLSPLRVENAKLEY